MRSKVQFSLVGKSNTVYVFEAPIDMLSFISMYQKGGWIIVMWHSVGWQNMRWCSFWMMHRTSPKLLYVWIMIRRESRQGERIKKNLSERGYHMIFSLFSNLRIGMRIFKNWRSHRRNIWTDSRQLYRWCERRGGRIQGVIIFICIGLGDVRCNRQSGNDIKSLYLKRN